jgi:hypothetical protein
VSPPSRPKLCPYTLSPPPSRCVSARAFVQNKTAHDVLIANAGRVVGTGVVCCVVSTTTNSFCHMSAPPSPIRIVWAQAPGAAMGNEASKPVGSGVSQRRASKEDIQALQAVGAYTDPMVPVNDYVAELVRVACAFSHTHTYTYTHAHAHTLTHARMCARNRRDIHV